MVAACLAAVGCRAAPQPSASGVVGPDARPDSGSVVQRLADGVYAVIRREPPAVINESNSLLVVGDREVLVVDAQSSERRTLETLAALRRITAKPVRYVVNTHWHDDHVVGNGVYRDSFPGVEFVAHERTARELATEGARVRRGFVGGRAGTVRMLQGLVDRKQSFMGGPLSDEERVSHLSAARLLADYSNTADYLPPVPTVLLTDRLELRLGERVVEVLHAGRAHTAGDVVVHLPAERIVAAGDVVMWPVQFVGTTSYPLDFGATVDRVRALRPRAIVPGHGPVLRDDRHPALVSAMLHALANETRAAVARGDSLAGAQRTITLERFRDAMAGASPVRRLLFSYYVTGSAVKRAWEQATAPAPR